MGSRRHQLLKQMLTGTTLVYKKLADAIPRAGETRAVESAGYCTSGMWQGRHPNTLTIKRERNRVLEKQRRMTVHGVTCAPFLFDVASSLPLCSNSEGEPMFGEELWAQQT